MSANLTPGTPARNSNTSNISNISFIPEKKVKILVVGDGAVGKTCLSMVFVDGKMPVEYVPTVFANHTINMNFQENVSFNGIGYNKIQGQDTSGEGKTKSYSSWSLFFEI